MRTSHRISPRLEARIAGVFYLLNMITGIAAMILVGRGMRAQGNAVNLIASVLYTAVTVMLWDLFRPIGVWMSSVAAVVSLLGCWLPEGLLAWLHLTNFAFFGVYCLMIALLIWRSRFMPGLVGTLMACAGLCWLTTLSRTLSHALSPYTLILGLIGEGTLIVYLLARGLDERRWREKAGSA